MSRKPKKTKVKKDAKTKASFSKFKKSIRERAGKTREKSSGFFSRAKSWFNRKKRKKNRSEQQTERKITRKIDMNDVSSNAMRLPEAMRNYEPIQRTTTTQRQQPAPEVQRTSTSTSTSTNSGGNPISTSRNINSLLAYWENGRPFVQFDSDEGKKRFPLTQGAHRLNNAYVLEFDGKIISVRNTRGMTMTQKPLQKTTMLILSSLIS